MEKIQNFSKGLNSDTSPIYQPEGTYVDALNMEIISDELQGSFAISNSKGNKFQIAVPDMEAIQRVTIVSTGATNITINGQSGAGATFLTPKDIYDYVSSDTNYSLFNVEYTLSYSNTVLIITPLPGFTVNIVVNPVFLNLEASFIPANSGLKIIGYGVIRNDIYLFTTNSNDTDPIVNGGGYGYIWRLTYNNITFAAADATITLIYAGDLGFSTYYNIPQTGVVGRYENSSTQRLYWTDNYNKLRSLNVVDPQLQALDITLVDVVPAGDFDVPLLQNLEAAASTANLPIGCYQMAYRLSNTGGSSTMFSVPSNPVFIVDADESAQTAGTNWKDYHGDIQGTLTTKRITWKINSLDRDFNRIEALLLVRENKNDIPTIYSFFEGRIQSDSITISVDGDIIDSVNTTDLSIDEFLALSATFTHCKTIGTKDNRLVVGNVRNEQADIEYDARAYRFKAANVFDLIDTKNSGIVVSRTAPADYTNVPDDSDAIAPFNLETTDPLYDANGKYRADGVTIGGEGPNISYEFYSVATAADKTVEPIAPQPLPIVSTNPDYVTGPLNLEVYTADKNGVDILQEYPLTFPSQINDGMKYPQMNSIYWGYQHNEIYRVGIQFFDKSKNPYFVKWIGDIQMPDYFDTCPAANNVYQDGSQTGLTDFRASFTDADAGVNAYGANEAYVCQLGIKFTVNIPSDLTNEISGYSIVRVERTESDKRIVAEGIISNTMVGPAPAFFLPIGALDYDAANTDKTVVNLLTPNVLDATLLTTSAGMKLRVSSYLSAANTLQDVFITGGSVVDLNKLLKMYTHTTVTSFECDITYATLMGLNASVTQTPNLYANMTLQAPNNKANGNPAYLLLLSTPISNAIGSGTTLTTDKFLCNIYNPIIDQYGGNTFTDRGNNVYVLCSHFRPTKVKLTAYSDTFEVYGGDVTNDIMDEERISKMYTESPETLHSTTFFYPSASPVNRELRHGRHPNTDLTDIPTPNNDRTDYFYNSVYSCTNNIVKYIPRPDPFIDITTYDNRFYISEVKINGELSDSWSMFKANNYWDVEGDKGPINSMLQLGEKMYFWQDRAFGIIEINPRVLINDASSTTNSQIQTGTGLPLQRHTYISTIVGTKHQGSTISSSDKLYWFDVNTKKIYSFSGGEGETPVSDVKGLYSFLGKNLVGEIQNWDKPTYKSPSIGVNGVSATYDNKRHKAIFTFHSGIDTGAELPVQTSFTLVLNERLGVFTTFHSFTPRVYINDFKHFFTTDNRAEGFLKNIYIHDQGNYGEYYTEVFDSYIKFIPNPAPQYTKVFDNLMFNSQSVTLDGINHNDDTWNEIRITNDYQNTDIQTLIVGTNIDRKERTWKLAIPRNRVLYTASDSPDIYTDLSPTAKTYGERMRDKYAQIELWYHNVLNSELRTNNVTTIFRQSPR